ncbi:MAG: 4a-hydroxytetrahydrobiopterin dehydratase [Armatimonadota bacterium]
MELADKKCDPCSGKMSLLSTQESTNLAENVPAWEVYQDHIERTFEFKNFVDAMGFANKIAGIAEEENHHPELHVSWGKVRVELTTHALHGLSANDFIVAAKIDRMAESGAEAQSI